MCSSWLIMSLWRVQSSSEPVSAKDVWYRCCLHLSTPYFQSGIPEPELSIGYSISLLARREIHHHPNIVVHQRLILLLTCLSPPRCVNSRHGFPVCEWFREIWSTAEIDKFQQWVLGKWHGRVSLFHPLILVSSHPLIWIPLTRNRRRIAILGSIWN